MARVDSLHDNAKKILQIGSVIERDFSYELMKNVADITDQELLPHISALIDSELIYQIGSYPKATYIFKHALTREVVSSSILKQQKKELHYKIAKVIEDFFKENLNEHYIMIAEHYSKSENYEKAADNYKKAARKAENSVLYIEAIDYSKKAISSLKKLAKPNEFVDKINHEKISLGLYLFIMSNFSEAKDILEPIYNESFKSINPPRQSLIHTILGSYYFMIEEEFNIAFQHFDKAIKISEDAEDIQSSVYANNFLGLALSWNCDFKKALKHLEAALDVVKMLNISWSQAVMESSISFYVYNYQGKVDLGYNTSNDALKLARASKDILSQAISFVHHGISCYYKGFFVKAEKYLLKGIELSKKISLDSFCAVAYHYLGYLYYQINEIDKSIEHYRKSIYFRECNKSFPSSINLSKLGIARSKAVIKKKTMLNLIYRYEADNKVKIHAGSMARFIGEILLKDTSISKEETEKWLTKAISIHERCGMEWHLASDYLTLSNFHSDKGNKPESRKYLFTAYELYKKCGATGWAEELEKNGMYHNR